MDRVVDGEADTPLIRALRPADSASGIGSELGRVLQTLLVDNRP